MCKLQDRVCVFDTRTGAELRQIYTNSQNGDIIRCVPDGSILLCTSEYGGAIAVINLRETGIVSLKETGAGHTVASRGCAGINSDGTRVCYYYNTQLDGRGANVYYEYDTRGGGPLRRYGGAQVSNTVGRARYSRDNASLVTFSLLGGTARVWDAAGNRQLSEISRGNTLNLDIHVSRPRGQVYWAATDGLETREMTGGERVKNTLPAGPWRAAGFSEARGKYACVGMLGDTFVVDVDTGKHRKYPGALFAGEPSVLQWCGSTGRFAVGYRSGEIRIYDDTLDEPKVATLYGHVKTVRKICFSPDGRRMATADEGGMLRIWNTALNIQILCVRFADESIARYNFDMAFDREGKNVVVACSDMRIVTTGPMRTDLRSDIGALLVK